MSTYTPAPTTAPPPPSWHAPELARRQKLYAEGKLPTSDWSEVKSRLEARKMDIATSLP